ncbi:hypothetical protein ABK040_003170 [Willaertia magna]
MLPAMQTTESSGLSKRKKSIERLEEGILKNEEDVKIPSTTFSRKKLILIILLIISLLFIFMFWIFPILRVLTWEYNHFPSGQLQTYSANSLGIHLIFEGRLNEIVPYSPLPASLKQSKKELPEWVKQLGHKRNPNFKGIPKIIHQTWKSTDRNTLPPYYIESWYEWQRLNPKYKYMLWSDDDIRELISTKYNWFLSTYDSYPYDIQRIYVGRYFILHAYGGVYCDLDIVPLMGIESLVEYLDELKIYETIIPRSGYLGFDNDFLMSSEKNPFFEQVISNLWWSHTKWFLLRFISPYSYIMLSSGQIFVTETFIKLVDKSKVAILSSDLYGVSFASFFNHKERYFD